MTRLHASIAAAMLFGIAACVSTPDSQTLANTNKNLEGTVQAQKSWIDRLTARNRELEQRVRELEAEVGRNEETGAAVRKARAELSAHVRAVVERFRSDSEIKIEPAASGYRFVLTERVLFPTGSAELTKAGKATLARVVDALQAHDFPAVIEGHTDNVPVVRPETLKKFPRGNMDLSVQRALSVWQYLVEVGKLDRTRLSVAGYGPNRPKAGNQTDFDRWQNRRVEILVIEKR